MLQAMKGWVLAETRLSHCLPHADAHMQNLMRPLKCSLIGMISFRLPLPSFTPSSSNFSHILPPYLPTPLPSSPSHRSLGLREKLLDDVAREAKEGEGGGGLSCG